MIAIALAATAGLVYLYTDPRHFRRRLIQRLWYLISKRDLSEAQLEREIVAERKSFFCFLHSLLTRLGLLFI